MRVLHPGHGHHRGQRYDEARLRSTGLNATSTILALKRS